MVVSRDGTYGGCATMRSNVSPATGVYRSPETAITLDTLLSCALNRAKSVDRSATSIAHALSAKLDAAARAATPVPAQRSRNAVHGVRGIVPRNVRVFVVIAAYTRSHHRAASPSGNAATSDAMYRDSVGYSRTLATAR